MCVAGSLLKAVLRVFGTFLKAPVLTFGDDEELAKDVSAS
jgi:hypothetical protein